MDVLYDPHLLDRLRERQIPLDWPRDIIEHADERYRDGVTRVCVALAKRWYKGEEREMAVSYVEEGADYRAITIHPLQRHQKQNRLRIGRWIKL